MKKILSLILVLTMLFSLPAVSSFAAAEDESRIDVLTEATEHRVADSKIVKFDVTKNYVYTNLPDYLVVDASVKYDYPVSFHTLIHVKDGETLAVKSRPYYISKNNILYGGDDKKIIIPVSSMEVTGADSVATTDVVNDVAFYFNGWGYEDYDSADVVTFNEIYFTDNPPAQEEGVVAEGDTLLSTKVCAIDNQNTLFGRPTNKWTFDGNKNFTIDNTLGDLSEYTTLNVMLYSENAVADTIGIRIVDSAKNNHGGKDITVDWIGWKKVEIPLSNYSGLDKTTVKQLYFANFGWNYGWNTDKTGNLGYMNIGKIWFSKTDAGAICEVYQEEESLIGKYTYLEKNLENAESLTFDIYNPTLNADYYAAYIIRNADKSVQQKAPVLLDFTGWKTVTVTLEDKVRNNPMNVYLSANWNLNITDKTAVPADYGVKVRNVKVNYSTTDCGETQADYVTHSGFASDNPYVSLNTGDIGMAEAVVIEKESGTAVEATTVICGNKIMIDFEKEAGKTYNINLASIVDYNLNRYSYSFDYTVNVNTGRFDVAARALDVSDENVKAYFDYSNFAGNAENAIIIIAVYDTSGTILETTKAVNYEQLQSGRAGELYAELEGNYTSKTVKAFAFDSLATLKPLCPAN